MSLGRPASSWAQAERGGSNDFRVQGVLVSAEDQTPIKEAIVRLMDAAGTQLDATLSAGQGEFSLEASRPGPFVLQVSRLGFEPWSSDVIDVRRNELLTLGLSIPVLPISLPDLEVNADRACEVPVQEARQAFFLYEAARPILRSVAEAERGGEYRYQVQVVSESEDRDGAVFDTTIAIVAAPISTASPADLATNGYLRAPNAATRLYLTPTAGVLASNEFEATHCFGIEIDAKSQRFGLTFTPRPDREVADVEGVLWYSYVDMRPTTVEFTFTRVRAFLEEYELPALEDDVRSRAAQRGGNRRISVGPVQLATEFGGMLRFEPLSDDLWITREWELRFPILNYVTRWEAGTATTRPSVEISSLAKPRTKTTKVLAVLRTPWH